MQKELIICIIIVIAIIVGNTLTHNNTKNAVSEVNKKLQEVTKKILYAQGETENKTENETGKSFTEEQKNTKSVEAEKEENTKGILEKQNIEDEITKSNELWNKEYQTLAYYIEHDELEKVSEALVRAKANISAEEYSSAIENIDSCIFLLQHIEEKDKFTLKNIF